MSTSQIVLSIIQMILAVIIIAVVLFQNAKDNRLGATITGGAESFFGKNKGRSIDAKLSKWTAVVAGVFALLTVAINVISAVKKS